jgi:hypothetical protein
MKLCSIDHEEVCYEAMVCPACALREELETIIDNQKEEIESLKDEIDSMTEEK